jgi:predicted extracellular nuclease
MKNLVSAWAVAFFLVLVVNFPLFAQKQVRAGVIAFYNLENLYDTVDDPEINDEEFLPGGVKNWDDAKYQIKLSNMAKVIARLGKQDGISGPAVIGVTEIENRKVLEDLVNQPELKPYNYQIIQYDSPDKRGIDVAFLYQPLYFQPTNSYPYPLIVIGDEGQRVYTRDQLVVSGNFDGEPMHFIVNHWPSRRGGAKPSKDLRIEAAVRCRSLVDSIINLDAKAKVVVMGDLNDDPIDQSVVVGLNANGNLKKLKKGQMYNVMYPFFKSGIGTLAYRDQWNLFDQIIITQSFITKRNGEYRFLKARIFNDQMVIQEEGKFKGYPFRTFSGNDFLGGYSDHFPVYMIIVKEI